MLETIRFHVMQYRKLFRCFDKPKKSQNVLDFIQGVPRNMTVDKRFEGCIRSLKLFAAFVLHPQVFRCI